MKYCMMLVLSVMSVLVYSQEVLLDEETEVKMTKKLEGPNSNSFGCFFVGTNFYVDPMKGDLAEVNYFATDIHEIGYRKKYKINRVLSAGYQFSYVRAKFAIKQTEEKVFPDTVQYEDQRVRTHQIRPGVYVRINFDPNRGNVMGKYLDLGFYGAFYTGRNHYTKIESESADSKYICSRETKYDAIEKYEYGFMARLGISRYALSVQYRLNEMIKAEEADFPKLNIGLQIGLHK